MNSRERVLLAINHEEADRLPVFRPTVIQTHEPLDEKAQNFLGTFEFDLLAGVGFAKARPEDRRKLPDDVFEDSYGCKFKYMGVGLPYCIHSPLAHARTIEDVERSDWPDVDNSNQVATDARERAREIHEKGEYATSVGVGMLFHRYQYLRGLVVVKGT